MSPRASEETAYPPSSNPRALAPRTASAARSSAPKLAEANIDSTASRSPKVAPPGAPPTTLRPARHSFARPTMSSRGSTSASSSAVPNSCSRRRSMSSPFFPPIFNPQPLHRGLSFAIVIFESSARRSATGNSESPRPEEASETTRRDEGRERGAGGRRDDAGARRGASARVVAPRTREPRGGARGRRGGGARRERARRKARRRRTGRAPRARAARGRAPRRRGNRDGGAAPSAERPTRRPEGSAWSRAREDRDRRCGEGGDLT